MAAKLKEININGDRAPLYPAISGSQGRKLTIVRETLYNLWSSIQKDDPGFHCEAFCSFGEQRQPGAKLWQCQKFLRPHSYNVTSATAHIDKQAHQSTTWNDTDYTAWHDILYVQF